MAPVHCSWLTVCAHYCPDQGQCPHTDSLFAHLHLAEEELHQLLGVGAGCRAEGAAHQSRLAGSASMPALGKRPGLPQVPADLTQGYEAVHDLHQVLTAELLLGWGLGAHLRSSAQGE